MKAREFEQVRYRSSKEHKVQADMEAVKASMTREAYERLGKEFNLSKIWEPGPDSVSWSPSTFLETIHRHSLAVTILPKPDQEELRVILSLIHI